MGLCTSKPTLSSPQSATHSPALPSQNVAVATTDSHSAEPHVRSTNGESQNPKELENGKRSPFFPFYSPSPGRYMFPVSPRRFFKRSFLSPSPAKHIRAALARRHGSVKPNEAAIPEAEAVAGLDKNFGFSKHFGNKYEVGDEVGRGHFGYTLVAKVKKGELKGQQVAVKVIPKAKVSTKIHMQFISSISYGFLVISLVMVIILLPLMIFSFSLLVFENCGWIVIPS